MAKRIFRDAPPIFRCSAAVQLKDKTWAQCGRWYHPGTRHRGDGLALLCSQHFEMATSGKPVRKFLPLAEHPAISGQTEGQA